MDADAGAFIGDVRMVDIAPCVFDRDRGDSPHGPAVLRATQVVGKLDARGMAPMRRAEQMQSPAVASHRVIPRVAPDCPVSARLRQPRDPAAHGAREGLSSMSFASRPRS